MPLYTLHCSSVSWDPIYSLIVLYKSMPAVVVLSVVSIDKYCTYIVAILKLMILIVKLYKLVHSIKYYKVIKLHIYIYLYIYIYFITCRINRFCCLEATPCSNFLSRTDVRWLITHYNGST
jgi:hypothetical protein